MLELEGGKSISDEEFKQIVEELRKNGVFTQLGAKEVISKKTVESSLSTAKSSTTSSQDISVSERKKN